MLHALRWLPTGWVVLLYLQWGLGITQDFILSEEACAAAAAAAYHALAALVGMCSSVLLCSTHAALVAAIAR